MSPTDAFPIQRAVALALTLTANPLQKCWMTQASALGFAPDQWPGRLLLEGEGLAPDVLEHRRVVDEDCHIYCGETACLHVFTG